MDEFNLTPSMSSFRDNCVSANTRDNLLDQIEFKSLELLFFLEFFVDFAISWLNIGGICY